MKLIMIVIIICVMMSKVCKQSMRMHFMFIFFVILIDFVQRFLILPSLIYLSSSEYFVIIFLSENYHEFPNIIFFYFLAAPIFNLTETDCEKSCACNNINTKWWN